MQQGFALTCPKTARLQVAGLLQCIRWRLIRGYGHDDWIRYETGKVVAGSELTAECEEILGNSEVAYVHIRSKFNCFQCRVDRGNQSSVGGNTEAP